VSDAEDAEGVRPPLPPRPPRPFILHWAVDAAVAFLATAFLLWFVFGVPIGIVVTISALLGLAAAPFTSRAEAEGLARRERGSPPDEGPLG